MSIDYSKGPLPDLDNPLFQPFWQAAQKDELRLPKCRNCNKFHWYRQILCPYCQSKDIEWVKMSGKGKIFTWTVVRHAFLPDFQSRVPFIIAFVVFDEAPGVRFVTNLVDCKPEDMRIGMPVEIVFQKVSEQLTMPYCRPAGVLAKSK